MKRVLALIIFSLLLGFISGPVMSIDDEQKTTDQFELVAEMICLDNFIFSVEPEYAFLPGGLVLKYPSSAWTDTYDNVLQLNMLLGTYYKPNLASNDQCMFKALNQSPSKQRFMAQHQQRGLHRLSLGEIHGTWPFQETYI